MKTGKRLTKAQKLLTEGKVYSLDESLEVVEKYKAEGSVKFDETVDAAFCLGIDPRQSDQNVRGATNPPHSLGKKVRVAVFAQPEKHEEAVAAGADIVGAEDLADKVKKGEIDFDVCIATNAMMRVVGQLGKVLGPKGLMPNPKLGTVTDDITKAVKEAKAGRVEFRADKAGIVHAPVGKLSMEAAKVKENLMHLAKTLIAAKPSAAKGTYIKKVYVNTTMGVAIPVDTAEFSN